MDDIQAIEQSIKNWRAEIADHKAAISRIEERLVLLEEQRDEYYLKKFGVERGQAGYVTQAYVDWYIANCHWQPTVGKGTRVIIWNVNDDYIYCREDHLLGAGVNVRIEHFAEHLELDK